MEDCHRPLSHIWGVCLISRLRHRQQGLLHGLWESECYLCKNDQNATYLHENDATPFKVPLVYCSVRPINKYCLFSRPPVKVPGESDPSSAWFLPRLAKEIANTIIEGSEVLAAAEAGAEPPCYYCLFYAMQSDSLLCSQESHSWNFAIMLLLDMDGKLLGSV
jgi:hypothetical protein